jgi:hypothetical protein
MEFRNGVLLMVTAAAVVVIAVTGIALVLVGGGGKGPDAGGPPAEDSAASDSASASPSGATPAPRTGRRPKTSASTMVGVPEERPPVTSGPTGPVTPSGLPSGWSRWNDPRYHRWHRTSPPPWWHHP